MFLVLLTVRSHLVNFSSTQFPPILCGAWWVWVYITVYFWAHICVCVCFCVEMGLKLKQCSNCTDISIPYVADTCWCGIAYRFYYNITWLAASCYTIYIYECVGGKWVWVHGWYYKLMCEFIFLQLNAYTPTSHVDVLYGIYIQDFSVSKGIN